MADFDFGTLESFDLDSINSILDSIQDLVSDSNLPNELFDNIVPSQQQAVDAVTQANFSEAQLNEIQKGLNCHLQTDIYAKSCYNWMQMAELRKGLMANLDVSPYQDPLFSANQMREIRIGLLHGLDVSSYAKFIFSASDMVNLRRIIFEDKYHKNPDCFGRYYDHIETGLQIRISNDGMKAFVRLPGTIPFTLSQDELIELLAEYGITYGLLSYAIRRLCKEKAVNEEICIAHGKMPSMGVPGRYELFFSNPIEQGYVIPPDDEIDYSNVNIIDVVKPGDPLAKYIPAQNDDVGRTVTEMPIRGSRGEDLPMLTGNGFEYDASERLYTATEKGYASYDSTTNALNVRQIYELRGDVSYYQNLEYDGTVHVFGSVQNLTVIRAKGDIIVDGFVENAQLHSEQNIVIKGGVNAGSGGHGVITAGGSIRGKFFENAVLRANGLIEGNYFLNCDITTDDRLIARGRKARIMGGRITAAIGVEAVIIGNYMSSKTVFNIGDFNDIDKRIMDLRKMREQAIDELQQLSMGSQKLSMLIGGKDMQQNSLYLKVNSTIAVLENQLNLYSANINRLSLVRSRAENAYVKVHGELQAHVVLMINGNIKKTEETVRRSILLTREKTNGR